MFWGGLLNTIKLFSTKCLTIFSSSYMKIVYLSFQDFFNKFFWSCQWKWFCTVIHKNICITRKFFLITIKNQGFQTWKNSKIHTKIIFQQKNFLSDLVSNLLIIFVSLMFSKNYWVQTGFVVVWHTSAIYRVKNLNFNQRFPVDRDINICFLFSCLSCNLPSLI